MHFPKTKSVAVLVGAAAVMAMAGCAAAPASGPVTLKLVATSDANQEIIQGIIDDYAEINPDVTVEATYSPTDVYQTNTVRSMESSNAPDLVMTFQGVSTGVSAYVLQDAGLAVDQSDAAWVSDLPESSRPLLGHDGFVAAKPVGVDTIGVVYNEQLFAEAGVEPVSTWTDLLALCDALNAKGIAPMSFGLQSSFVTLFGSFALASSTVYTPQPTFDADLLDGSATFSDTEGWTVAWEKFVEMKDAGCFAPGYEGTTYDAMLQQVATRDVAMTITVAPSLGAIRAANPDDDFSMFPVPAFDDAELNGVPQSLSVGMAINAKSPNIDAARAFVDFVNNDENSALMAQAYSVIPISAGAPVPEGLDAMIEAFAQGRVGTFSNQAWVSADTTSSYIAGGQEVLLAQKSIADFLAAVDATVETR
ncbi:extracellular solute-binding protein [soil metagenome]